MHDYMAQPFIGAGLAIRGRRRKVGAAVECSRVHSVPFMDEPMPATSVEIIVDLPPGATIGEYERIGEGHSFHVRWDFPTECVCETCKQKRPLHRVEKAKFLVIRDLEIWG